MRYKRTQRPRQQRDRINSDITASEVRLIDENDAQVGIVSIKDALFRARNVGLDLVEIATTAKPPVCKIIDFGKYNYQQSKKKKENKKNQKVMHLKEIKMRPKTDVHDYKFKVKHIIEFINAGNRVKITIKFRGREMAFLNTGREQLNKVVEDTKDIAKVESMPKVEGKNMIMVLVPNKDKLKEKEESKTQATNDKSSKPKNDNKKTSQEVVQDKN